MHFRSMLYNNNDNVKHKFIFMISTHKLLLNGLQPGLTCDLDVKYTLQRTLFAT